MDLRPDEEPPFTSGEKLFWALMAVLVVILIAICVTQPTAPLMTPADAPLDPSLHA